MADELTFLMGKFPARLPGELRYARTHLWCRPGDGVHRFGFTSYAIRLMQDVYFLEWHRSPGDPVTLLQHIGHIETSKAVSDLFAPLAGTIVSFNTALLDDPSTINVEGYGAGWLFDMECDPSTLLDASAYAQHLADNWEKTQRLIKGKINTED
jgi:glycine cleavage system H protein